MCKISLLDQYMKRESEQIAHMTISEFKQYAEDYLVDPDLDVEALKLQFLQTLRILRSEYSDEELKELMGIKDPDVEEDNWVIDLPDIHNLDYESPWVAVSSFKTKAEAIAWAMENLGADEEGKLTIISSL